MSSFLYLMAFALAVAEFLVRVNYSLKTVFIRFLGTHAEYDEIVAEEV